MLQETWARLLKWLFTNNVVTIITDHLSSALLTKHAHSLCIFLANWVSVSDFSKHTESSGMKLFL